MVQTLAQNEDILGISPNTVRLAQVLTLIEDFRSISPNAVRLAQIVSLAAQVEPELLRKARLELLPGVDAGAEADLWFSPFVQSENVLALVFLPEVEELLRQELSKDQKLLNRAWRLLQKVHENAPIAIRLEEEITWLALSKRSRTIEIIEQRFQSVISAMVNENRLSLAHWAARALPRLPKRTRKSNAFWMLAIVAGVLLRGRQIVREKIPKDVLENRLPWVLPKDMPRIQVGVRLVENGIEFGDLSMDGAHTIELPRTNPLLLEMSWTENANLYAEWVIWEPNHSLIVKRGRGTISLRTVQGEVYSLYPQQVKGKSPKTKSQQERFIKELEASISNFLAVEHDSQSRIGYYFVQKKELIEVEQWKREIWKEIPQFQIFYGQVRDANTKMQNIHNLGETGKRISELEN